MTGGQTLFRGEKCFIGEVNCTIEGTDRSNLECNLTGSCPAENFINYKFINCEDDCDIACDVSDWEIRKISRYENQGWGVS